MKKIVFVLIIASLYNIQLSDAQTNRGRVLIGASSAVSLAGSGPNVLSLGFRKNNHKNDTIGNSGQDVKGDISLNLMPRVGFFIFKNFVLGADLCIGYNTQNDVNSEIITNTYAAGPFIRYYFPTEKVRPFIECNAVFGNTRVKYVSSGTTINDQNTEITSFGSGLGVAFRIGDKSTIDFLAAYNSVKEKYSNYNPFNQENSISSFGVRFGFTYYLGSEPEF
jgi:hypothetical protein